MKIKNVSRQELKAMALHEYIAAEGVHILRVVAGWIYFHKSGAVFVPER